MRTLGAAILIVGAAVGAGIAAQQAQAPAAPNPIVGPPIVPLEESYLRWPLPASAAAYGRIDGNRLKPYVEQLAAISRKSRDAGNQWWGRITGTPADFSGRDVRGKAVFIYSIPTPSALNHSAKSNGAMLLAEDKGAAAIVIILGLPGNFTTQLWGSGGEGPNLTKVPWFSVGLEDGTAARELMEQGQPVNVRMRLAIESRPNLKPSAVFGVLPGMTDENILVIAHTDGFWEAAVDNGSGVAAMLGLAEYFSKIPKEQRRRTITFMAPIGHHVTPDFSLQKLHDNRATFFARTALIINAEHVTTTQTYLFGTMLRKSNAATAHRFFVGRSRVLAQILVEDFKLFGVALYELPSTRFGVAGDLVKLTEDAPGIEVIESNAFYHSDLDTPDIVPAAGLESITRAYAKIIDDINTLDLKDIVDAPSTSTVRR